MPDLVRESFDFSGGTVDETGPYPIIRGVLICGKTSEHGYDYLPSAWSDEALKQYEGIASYEGHKDGSRLPSEKVGWFANVTRRADGQPVGDYYLEPDHPLTPRLIRAAKPGGNPKFYAMSHQAHVVWGKRDGRKVVESIGRAHSVDVVSKGGTTGGIFESGKTPTGKAMKVSEYANKLAPKCSVEQLLKLRSLVREDGVGDAAMPADAPAPDAADTTGDGGVDAAFLTAATAEIQECMDAKGDKEKLKKCLAKLKKLLMMHGEINADDVPDEPAAKADDAAKAEEAAKVAAAKASATDPWELIKECEVEKFTPSALQLTALKGIGDKGQRTAFIREQKGLKNATDPRSVSREQIAGAGSGTVKEDGTGNGQQQTGVQAAAERARKYAAEHQGVKPQ